MADISTRPTVIESVLVRVFEVCRRDRTLLAQYVMPCIPNIGTGNTATINQVKYRITGAEWDFDNSRVDLLVKR